MKPIFYLLLINLLFPLWVYGDSNNGNISNLKVVIKKSNPTSSRPRIPSYQRVDASFDNGILHIEFKKPEGMASVELFTIDNSTQLTRDFDTSDPYDLKTGDIALPAEFTISTDLLNEYSGLIFEDQ